MTWPLQLQPQLLIAGLALLIALPLATCSSDPGSSSQDGGRPDARADTAAPDDARPDARPDDARPDARPDAGPADGTGDAPASQTLRLEGSAAGTDPDTGDQVDCRFFGEVTMIEPGDTGWTAFASGEVLRTITRDGLPLEFQAVVAGPSSLVAASDGTVELRWVGDQSAPEVRPFWKELEVLVGMQKGTLDYAGPWQCAPIEPEPGQGFQDSPLVVDGTWTLGPP